jgi:hypothetical protein
MFTKGNHFLLRLTLAAVLSRRPHKILHTSTTRRTLTRVPLGVRQLLLSFGVLLHLIFVGDGALGQRFEQEYRH